MRRLWLGRINARLALSRSRRIGRWRRYSRLLVVRVDDGLGDIGGWHGIKHHGILLIACVQHQRESVLLRVIGHQRAHFFGYGADQLLQIVLEVALRVLRFAVQLLLLLVQVRARLTRSDSLNCVP